MLGFCNNLKLSVRDIGFKSLENFGGEVSMACVYVTAMHLLK